MFVEVERIGFEFSSFFLLSLPPHLHPPWYPWLDVLVGNDKHLVFGAPETSSVYFCPLLWPYPTYLLYLLATYPPTYLPIYLPASFHLFIILSKAKTSSIRHKPLPSTRPRLTLPQLEFTSFHINPVASISLSISLSLSLDRNPTSQLATIGWKFSSHRNESCTCPTVPSRSVL